MSDSTCVNPLLPNSGTDLELDTFKPSDRAFVKAFKTQSEAGWTTHQSCEFSFVNLFCWAWIYDYAWFMHENRIVIHDGKDRTLFMPIGAPMTPESLARLSEKSLEMGLSADICLVPEDYLELFPDIDHYYEIMPDRDAGEYIYLSENLSALKGGKLHKKRNLISQFKRRYPDYQVHPLTPERLSSALQFSRNLLNAMDTRPPTLVEEFSAMEKAFNHWQQLALEGLLILINNEVAAFSVFSNIGHSTYNVHFEKSNITFKGAAQLINHETAAFIEKKAEFINREQDLGIKGLRQAKLSYEPYKIWIPYVLRYKK